MPNLNHWYLGVLIFTTVLIFKLSYRVPPYTETVTCNKNVLNIGPSSSRAPTRMTPLRGVQLMSMVTGISFQDNGVDVNVGTTLVQFFRPPVRSTKRTIFFELYTHPTTKLCLLANRSIMELLFQLLSLLIVLLSLQSWKLRWNLRRQILKQLPLMRQLRELHLQSSLFPQMKWI